MKKTRAPSFGIRQKISTVNCFRDRRQFVWRDEKNEPGRPAVETVVVDVIEEPAPGVITVTEFEETQIPAGRDDREEC